MNDNHKQIAWQFLFIFLLLASSIPLVAQELMSLPNLSGRVVDHTSTLDDGNIKNLDAKLAAYEKEQGTQIVVVLVPTTSPESIAQYSMRLAEHWKIGQAGKDNGVILLIAKQDRKLRIEVGYGLEGRLPDVRCQQIIDSVMVPAFKRGNFAEGIDAGIDQIIGYATGEFDPAEALNVLPDPEQPIDELAHDPFRQYWGWINDASYIWLILCGIMALVFLGKSKTIWWGLIIPALSFGLPMLGLGLWDSYFLDALMMVPIFCIAFSVLWLIFRTEGVGGGGSYSGSSYTSSFSGSSSYSSSSSSYSSSSSGSSFSGSSFSGGGGSFGGGGASGSW